MGTHPKGEGVGGVTHGHIETEIIKAIGRGIAERQHVQRAVARIISPRWFPAVIGKMLAARLIYEAQAKGGADALGCTEAGLVRLPKQQPSFMDNWKSLDRGLPPVRRPGSDAALKVPSLMAGQLHNWRHPV